jgi:hypothetical protein
MNQQNDDGVETVFATVATGDEIPKGERGVMNYIDCHNRAAIHLRSPAVPAIRVIIQSGGSRKLPINSKARLENLSK